MTYTSPDSDRLRELMFDTTDGSIHKLSKFIYDTVPEVRTGVVKISRYATKGLQVDAGGVITQNTIDKFNTNLGNSLNMFYTLDQFSEMIIKQAVLYGLVIVEKIYTGGKLTDVRVLDRNMLYITKNQAGRIEKVSGIDKKGESKDLNLNNLIIMPLDATYYGEIDPSTPVSVVADDVALYIEIMEDFATVMKRYAYPHIHVSLPETVSDNILDKIQAEVETQEAESSFVTVGGDVDILDGQKNLSDVKDVLHHLQMTIASGLMIPAFMLEFSEGSNRSLGKEQRRDMQRVISAYRTLLVGLMKRVYSDVIDNISRLKITFDDYDVDDDNTLQKNRVLFAQSLSAMQKNGFEVEDVQTDNVSGSLSFDVNGGESKVNLKYVGVEEQPTTDVSSNLVREPDVVAPKEKRAIGDNNAI